MTLVGFLLLLSGWGIVLTAIVILNAGEARIGFVFAGLGVELIGLAMVFHSHTARQEDKGREGRA